MRGFLNSAASVMRGFLNSAVFGSIALRGGFFKGNPSVRFPEIIEKVSDSDCLWSSETTRSYRLRVEFHL